jgi:hypothetical protein
MAPRPTPLDLVFGPFLENRFPGIRSALAENGRDPVDRDAFLMEREVVLLLRELRPASGLGEGMDQLVALLHHAYLVWEAGGVTVEIPGEALAELLGPTPPAAAEAPRPFYAQLPERRIWAEAVQGTPPEPLDGCFVHTGAAGELRVLGIFGLHAERMGFSVVETLGPRPEGLARSDESALFAPTLPGGAAAGLYSLSGAEELLELGWRTTAGVVQWTP